MVFLYPFLGKERDFTVIRNYRMLLHGSGAKAHSLRNTRKSGAGMRIFYGITASFRDENVYTGAAGAATHKRRKI